VLWFSYPPNLSKTGAEVLWSNRRRGFGPDDQQSSIWFYNVGSPSMESADSRRFVS